MCDGGHELVTRKFGASNPYGPRDVRSEAFKMFTVTLENLNVSFGMSGTRMRKKYHVHSSPAALRGSCVAEGSEVFTRRFGERETVEIGRDRVSLGSNMADGRRGRVRVG